MTKQKISRSKKITKVQSGKRKMFNENKNDENKGC